MRSLISAVVLTLAACTPVLAQERDTLKVGMRGLPPGLGNPYTANGTPSSYVWMAMFDALSRLDVNGALQPALATGWEKVDDTTWRFSLRPGIRFHNGAAFDSSAVVGAVQWLMSAEGRGSVVGAELRNLAGAEAISPTEVLVRTTVPDAVMPAKLSGMFLVEPGAWASLGPQGFAKAPVGTGPYRLVAWAGSDGRAELAADPNSWRAPTIPKLQVFELPEGSARVQGMMSGQLDLTTVDIDVVELLRQRGFRVEPTPGLQVMSVAFITERDGVAPLQDVRVRQALNYAVDKQAIAEALLLGLAPPAGQPAARQTNGHDPAIQPYPYDPEKAKALLAEAGYPDGFPLTLDVVVNSVPGDAAIYQTVGQFLDQVGVRTTLNARPFAAWLQDFLGNSFKAADGFGLSWNATPYNDVIRPMEIFSCGKANPFFCEPSLMPALAEANREFDPAARLAKLQALSRQYHDAAPALFLVEQFDLFALSPNLAGFSVANRVPIYEALRFE